MNTFDTQPYRPKLTVPLAPLDRAMEAAALFALIGTWALTIYLLAVLPERIPTHYTFTGQIDRYGGKGMIVIFPILATALYSLLTLISRYQQLFNFPVTITEANAARQYAMATRLMRAIKTLLVLFFLFTVWQTGYNATHTATLSVAWDLLLLFVPLVTLMVSYIIRARKAR